MSTITRSSFAEHAGAYRAAGLVGTLLLPAGKKFPPPSGYTGEDGRWPTDEDIATWSNRAGDAFNLALRLPEDLIGIDVDAYDDKPGAATLADAESRWGVLPATYASSAREDGVSGIRLYRIPTGLDWPNIVGPGIETIRYGHRYIVAAPSINPKTDTAYRWTAPDGAPVDVPDLSQVPDLPEAWIAGLTGGRAAGPRRSRTTVDVDDWLGNLPDGAPCDDVAEVLDRWRLALNAGSSRYEAMRDATMALVFRGHAGCPGVARALMDLQGEYASAIAGAGERDPHEWLRSLHGAVEKTAGEPVEDYERCSVVQAALLLFTPPERPSLWDERPILRHLHDFARGRRVAPLAVLGVALARVVAATPSNIVLPPIIGSDGTLNLFVAFVGASGQGKGAAEAAAADAIDLSQMLDRISGEPVRSVNVGSGEGFVHQYVTRKAGEMHRLRDSVLFSIPEVDTLTALGNRQGATLMPTLRSAWSGEPLGFSYADPSKALDVPARSYRCSLLLGVQPSKAGPLLEDADGGTPQRFMWVPVIDPDMPRERAETPEPKKWDHKFPTAPRYEMAVCEEAWTAIDEGQWRRSRGEGDPLDGHRLYCRLKVAAALALLDRRLEVTASDWRLSGRIMAQSDETRAGVQRTLRERASEANVGRARAEAARAVVVAEEVDALAVKKASQAVKTALGKRSDEWVSASDLRRGVAHRLREHLDPALDALSLSGDIEAEAYEARGRSGTRYRLHG